MRLDWTMVPYMRHVDKASRVFITLPRSGQISLYDISRQHQPSELPGIMVAQGQRQERHAVRVMSMPPSSAP